MADSLAFTAIDELSIQKLNDTHETDAVKSMLSEAIGVAGDDDLDEAQKEVAIDFYFYCFAFCKECGFDTLKTSTFLSIAKQTCNFIRLDASTDMNTAFEKFKALMFAHAVERSPHAVLIFSVEDVEKVTEFMLNSYFRHFKLYKYIFTAKEQVTLVQELPHGVEVPAAARPLDDALTQSIVYTQPPEPPPVEEPAPAPMEEEEEPAVAEGEADGEPVDGAGGEAAAEES